MLLSPLAVGARNGGAAPAVVVPPFDPASLFAGGEAGGVYALNDAAKVFADSGTTPASNDGVLGQINDVSGLNNHLVQTNNTLRPLWKTSGGVYWAEFDASDDAMQAATNIALSPTMTIVAAMRQVTGASSSFRQGPAFYVGSTDFFAISLRSNAGSCISGARTTVIPLVSTAGSTAALDTDHVLAATLTPGVTTLKVNNGAVSNSAANSWTDPDSVANSKVSLMQGTHSAVIRFYAGIWINRALTADEELNARKWVGARSGAVAQT